MGVLTCNTDDNLLPSDPRRHAEQNLMSRMEVVERPSQRDDGQGRFDSIRVRWEGKM